MFSADDYDKALDRLLPRGPIWRRTPGSVLDSILHAIARELARVDAQADRVLEEADPRTSFDLLQQWFTDWGIPSACLAALADPTLEEKRRELIAKITSSRSLTANFFRDVAETLGYEADIVTYSAFTVKDTADKPLFGTEWNTAYAMGITVRTSSEQRLFNTTWTVDQPLAVWGDRLFECLMRELVPAHVTAIFEYKGETR